MPEITVTKQAWKCSRCKYEWIKKKNKDGTFLVPELCANCHSPYWNRNRLK